MTLQQPLPTALHTAAGSRELDRLAIDELGIPGAHLMQRAGRAAFEALLRRWPAPAHIHVCCGTGNNGGDGFVIAALARSRAIPVSLWQVGDAARIGGDALLAKQMAQREGVIGQPFAAAAFERGIIVDALLGTGLGGAVREPFAGAIEAINASGLPVLAVDIPSGLCSDTGAELGVAVRADLTVTFIAMKQGLLTGRGPALCGECHFDDLQLPAALLGRVAPSAQRLDLAALNRGLPRRPRDAHKGDFGHLLVVGGDYGFGGAVAMAAEAAARLGAGLTSCATRAEHLPALLARRPELMAAAVRSGEELAPLLARASCVVIGPGLGQAAWGQQLLQRVLATALPLVLDADALNLLARLESPPRRGNWIVTPHPGEAARLLGCDTPAINRDRFGAAAELQRRYGGAVILKGSGTLVADEDGIAVCPYGNPGMASGGMGDVLSGVLGGLLAQGLAPGDAARLGCCLHAAAADAAAQQGERGLLATDLMPALRRLANP